MDDLRRQASSLGLGALTSMAETINTTLGSMTGAISPRMRLELLAARLLAGREGLDVAPAAGGTAPGADSAGTGRGAAGVNARTGGIAESRSGGTTPRRGGFIGSARNQQTDARQSAASQTNTSPSRTAGTQPDRALQTEAPTMAKCLQQRMRKPVPRLPPLKHRPPLEYRRPVSRQPRNPLRRATTARRTNAGMHWSPDCRRTSPRT